MKMFNVDKIIGTKKDKQYILNGGMFIPNSYHKTKPDMIDNKTWWIPLKSGRITKGYFKGLYYDNDRKSVIHKDITIFKI